MKYVQYINERIKTILKQCNLPLVVFGQNITAGSCLSGLTKGLKSDKKCLVINTPNVENTQVGVGFGLMLNTVSSIFFMKQQDFLLLGIDHLVNTYNFLRQNKPLASFTIFTIVVDKGHEGIQSSLNNCGDFCSIARIPGYTITNQQDADRIIEKHLVAPGFRIIGVSQRLFPTEILRCESSCVSDDNVEIFQYYQGKNATIACFNFSFPQGLKLYNEFKSRQLEVSLFSVNASTPVDWGRIIKDVSFTHKLVVLDDAKSVNRSCYHLVNTVYKECNPDHVVILTREICDDDLCPNPDEFIIDNDAVIRRLMNDNLVVQRNFLK